MLFVVCHTVALLQACMEVEHAACVPSSVRLVPSASLTYRGAPLGPTMRYVWGEWEYAFPTPLLLPMLGE